MVVSAVAVAAAYIPLLGLGYGGLGEGEELVYFCLALITSKLHQTNIAIRITPIRNKIPPRMFRIDVTRSNLPPTCSSYVFSASTWLIALRRAKLLAKKENSTEVMLTPQQIQAANKHPVR